MRRKSVIFDVFLTCGFGAVYILRVCGTRRQYGEVCLCRRKDREKCRLVLQTTLDDRLNNRTGDVDVYICNVYKHELSLRQVEPLSLSLRATAVKLG